MKQTTLALCLSAAAFIFSQQASAQKNILVGIQGGLSIPNLTSGSSVNPVASGWSSRLGPDFGIMASFKVKKMFSIQVELNYSSQGGKKDGPQAVPSSYFTTTPPSGFPEILYANLNNQTKIGYVQLPVLAKITLPLNKGLSFFVDAGPYAGLMVSAKTVANGNTQFYTDQAETNSITGGQSYAIDVNQDIRSDIKHINVGIQGGIGLQQKLYLGYLTLTAGGTYGFIPIQRDGSNGQNNTGAATVRVGYMIKI
jgi:hypothetical protein